MKASKQILTLRVKLQLGVIPIPRIPREECAVVLIPNESTKKEEQSKEGKEVILAPRKEADKEALQSLLDRCVKDSSAGAQEERVELDNSKFLETRLGQALQKDAEREVQESSQIEEEADFGRTEEELECTYTPGDLEKGDKTPTREEEDEEESQERKEREYLEKAAPKKGFRGRAEEHSLEVDLSSSGEEAEETKEEKLLKVPEEYFKEPKKDDPEEGSTEWATQFRERRLSWQTASRLLWWTFCPKDSLMILIKVVFYI